MKNLKDCLVNENYTDSRDLLWDIRNMIKDKNHYPTFIFPDGKEYVIETYENNHKDNGHGAYHQGFKFVEAKYAKSK